MFTPVVLPSLLMALTLLLLMVMSWQRHPALFITLTLALVLGGVTQYAPLSHASTGFLDSLTKLCLMLSIYLALTRPPEDP